ncbi:MAG: serine/threonine protein kinase [Deltaproteobacteria bacterium]|nr:serine/threonine protein kinase [Deltaproteobacteria bacterium]
MTDGLQNVPVLGAKRAFPRSFGRYILERSLSRGGMGEVFLAIAKHVREHCVIKTIRGDLTGDEEFIGRFADEAKIMVRMTHENIIRVFDAGRVDDDYYIAMEFMHGRDLGDVLDRAYERGEPMPMQLGLYITASLLRGLDYAHNLCDEHGRHMALVHRDVSPQNVLIGFDGSVKLIDFGLARTELLPARTQGALAVGKYGYMAPEQARHEKIDGRADVYSTGVMLFEVFTSDRLVDEQDQATLWQRVLNPKHRSPRSVLPSLPKEIDSLVMRAVGVLPEDRFQSCAQMLEFVESMRNRKSNREELVNYLKELYPRVDFRPPPIPQLETPVFGQEKSLIIATSREGALSVFGRGVLPIEWTAPPNTVQFQAKQVRRMRESIARNEDAIVPSDVIDSERETTSDRQANRGVMGRTRTPHLGEPDLPRIHEIAATESSADIPTQVGMLPTLGTADPLVTAHMRPPSFLERSQSLPGIENAPVLGLSGVAQQFRDDEATVMMDAPPGVEQSFGPVVVGGDRSNAPTRVARRPNFLNSDAASEDVPIVEHATTVDPHPHPSLGSVGSQKLSTRITRGERPVLIDPGERERERGHARAPSPTSAHPGLAPYDQGDAGLEIEATAESPRHHATREIREQDATRPGQASVAHRATVPPAVVETREIALGHGGQSPKSPVRQPGANPANINPNNSRSIGPLSERFFWPGVVLFGIAALLLAVSLLLTGD